MDAQLRIAVADDEPEMTEYLREVLSLLGHEVVAAVGCGRELVEQCGTVNPDLVITDVRMPDMSGLEAVGELRRRGEIPVILVSAYHEPEIVAEAVRQRVIAYLVKPIKQADLENAITLAMWRFRECQQLAAELIQSGDRERQRLARILHDHLQQLLIAAKMEVGVLLAQLQGSRAKDALRRVEDLLSQSISAARTLTAELSPTVLYQAGLVPALRWLADRMQQLHGLTVELSAAPDAEPKSETHRILLFEAVRELLLNIVKHAGVLEADIDLHCPDRGHIRVIVTDHGRGFAPARPEPKPADDGGFGLFSVRRHVEIVGGRLEVDSVPGQGTRVTLELPVEHGIVRSAEPAEPAFLRQV